MKAFLKKAILFLTIIAASTAMAATKWEVRNGNLITAGNLYGCRLQEGEVSNCALGVSGSTLTISGEGGNALSSTNKCQIGIRSTTSGQVVCAEFTSNVTVTFGSSSDTDGNLFGISDVDWTENLPMFLHIIYDGTTAYFAISRKPHDISGSVVGNLCQKGDTDCDSATDLMILTTGLTLSNWTSKPLLPAVAWFNATYATSGGAWTFTLAQDTGFNHLFERSRFKMVAGHFGAASGSFFSGSGSTPPSWANAANIDFYYRIHYNEQVEIEFDTTGAGNATNGSGAGALILELPYIHQHDGAGNLIMCGAYVRIAGAFGIGCYNYQIADQTGIGFLTAAGATLAANSFSNTSDDLSLTFRYETGQ